MYNMCVSCTSSAYFTRSPRLGRAKAEATGRDLRLIYVSWFASPIKRNKKTEYNRQLEPRYVFVEIASGKQKGDGPMMGTCSV